MTTKLNGNEPGNLIEIPDEALIECPKCRPQWSVVAECPGCEYYKGLVLRADGPQLRFAQKYLVSCAHPRGMAVIERKS